MADEDVKAARLGFYLGSLEGLVRCGEDLAGRSSRIAPLEEGTLRASAAVTIIVNGARFEGSGALERAKAAVRFLVRQGQPVKLDVEVSFNTIYAARQHEELDWIHRKGGEAKYLERPLLEQADRYAKIIGNAAARGAERGAT